MKDNRGIALAEIIVGAAIISSVFVALLGVYASMSRVSMQALPRIQASMLAEEALEVARSLRDAGYASQLSVLTNGTPYYLVWSTASSAYVSTTTPSLIDNTFTRTLTLAPAYRDGSFNLASSGALDSNTKLVTASVTWNSGSGTTTYTLKSYVSNIFNN